MLQLRGPGRRAWLMLCWYESMFELADRATAARGLLYELPPLSRLEGRTDPPRAEH